MRWLKYSEDLDVPGTSILVDETKKLVAAEETDDHIVYIPQPSDSPLDPLRWSRAWKLIHYSVCLIFVLVAAATASWNGILYDIFVYEFGVSYNQLNTGSGLSYLFLAFGCWFTQISANVFGRRPTYLFFTVLVILASIVFAARKNYSGYLVYNILNGLGVAPIDTLVQVTIGDVFFLHQHGRLMALYTLCLATGSSFGPIITGYISSHGDWSWTNYTIIILMSFILICQILFIQESYFDRESSETALSMVELHKSPSVEKSQLNVETQEIKPESLPFLQRLKFMRPRSPNGSIFKLVIAPFKTLRYPAVAWVAVAYGLQMCWLSLLSLTVAQFFASPPYLFSTAAMGNTSYAGVIGSIIGPIYVSFSDKYCIWRAKRNNGILEPEFRLDFMWLPLLINTLGLLLYGFCPYYQWKWIVGVIGIGFINFGICTITSCMLTYVLECYTDQVTDTMSSLLFIRNIVGAIFNWVFQDWLDAMGIKNFTILMAVLCVVINGFGFIFVIYGKSFRKLTAKWYVEASQHL